MAQILLVEDDDRVASFIEKGLSEHLFNVERADDGFKAVGMASVDNFDLIILDLLLPGLDGLNVCRILREKRVNTPILILSALDDTGKKVTGLEAGADDYLVKPFHFDELLARINALLRRAAILKDLGDVYEYADLKIDIASFTTERAGVKIRLSQREFKLLLFLMENRERTVSRAQIAGSVWNINFDRGTNVVDVYINYLRNKVDKPFAKPLIHTIKGRGYLFSDRYDAP